MGDENGERAPEEIAREHEKIQREIENRARRTEGGLTPDDITNIARQQTEEDFHRVEREQWLRENRLPDIGRNPMSAKPILDENVRRYINTDVARDLLKKPENMMRLVAAGLGIFGIILLSLGLRTEAKQTTSGATTVPTVATTTPPVSVSVSQEVVNGTATATASFSKVSGPCSFASQFTDNYSFVAKDGALTLTQLSDNHVTYGTIGPTGDFATTADGQAYNGNLDGTMATGQHLYTAEGCNEVYDFTMQLSAPLPTTNIPVNSVTITISTNAPAVTATTVPITSSGGGRNIPLAAFGFILLISAIALFYGGSRLAGGPVIAKPTEDEDPCAKERARLAVAENARDAADERLTQLDELERNVQSTQRDAAVKQQATTAAASSASSYEGADGKPVYTNPRQRAQIEAAQAAATAARQAAESAQGAYDAAGGAGARRAAADDVYRAHREYGDAKASLDACLHVHTAANPSPPRTAGGTSTTGGTTQSGPSIAAGTGAGPSTQTRQRTCTDGEIKPDSERSTTREITVNEINQAVITLDPTYPNALSVPLTEFVEFMDFFRRAFKAGKAIRTVIEGTIVEGALDTIDATGFADVPDFLTYWDKLTEATLRGLKQTGDIFIDRFSKLGDYQLTFTRRIYTATCRVWEECVGGQWVQKHEVKVEITRTERNRRTRTISVQDKREIADSINRLFTDLERENQRGTRDLKAFEESCGH